MDKVVTDTSLQFIIFGHGTMFATSHCFRVGLKTGPENKTDRVLRTGPGLKTDPEFRCSATSLRSVLGKS